MREQRIKIQDFLADLRSGKSFSELIREHNFTDKSFYKILRKLDGSDLSALKRRWEQEKIAESIFMRAFREVEEDLSRKD